MWPGLETDALGDYARVLINRDLYGDTAVFKTAYWFTDRFYVFLDTNSDNRLLVELRAKQATQPPDLQAACAEFCNALVDFRVRAMVLNESHTVREALVTKAFLEGIPTPPVPSD